MDVWKHEEIEESSLQLLQAVVGNIKVDVGKSLWNVATGENNSNSEQSGQMGDCLVNTNHFSKMSAVGTNCLLCANTATDTKLCGLCNDRVMSKSHHATIEEKRDIKRELGSRSDSIEKKSKVESNIREAEVQNSKSYFPGIKLPWYEGCVYGCGHCEAYFWDTAKVLEHVKRNHRKKYKLCRNITKHMLYVKTGYWDCTFCLGMKIKMNKSCISGHLSSKHGIDSIEEYEKISGQGPPDEIDFVDVAVTVKQEDEDDGIESKMSLNDAITVASLGVQDSFK